MAIRDFTVLISMPHSQLLQVLGYFRDIYDGEICREFGTNGGFQNAWSGRIGMLGCVTPEIDRCHQVNSTMGDRTLLIRMGGDDRFCFRQALLALQRPEPEATRAVLARETRNFLNAVSPPMDAPLPQLAEDVNRMLASLATVASACRSAVQRDSSGGVGSVPQVEGPSRMGLQLRVLYQAHRDIGLLHHEAWESVTHIAMSSMPPMRSSVFRTVLANPGIKVYEVAEALRLKTASTRRAIQELFSLGVLTFQRWKSADLYAVSEVYQELSRMAGIHPEAPDDCTSESFPEKSHPGDLPSLDRPCSEGMMKSDPQEHHVSQSANVVEPIFPEKEHAPCPATESNEISSDSVTPKRKREAASLGTKNHEYPLPDHMNSRPLKAGMVFGSWTALEDAPRKPRGKVLCRCICGKERGVRLDNLYSGMSKSCGCRSKKNSGEQASDHSSVEGIPLSDAETEAGAPSVNPAEHASAACMA